MRADSILALDVGGTRIGVAVASLSARLPRPLTTLGNDESFSSALNNIIQAESVAVIVVGLPRGLDGQHTEQTKAVETFTKALQQQCSLPTYFQDEAVTSKQAEAELQARGDDYQRGDIDALAATYILEDFLSDPQNLVKLESNGTL